ncbi:hypothetical protein CERSUDRAFT_75520 [Gelatoporia subvermispora B]|uniref:Uncharacterized protein n=1 Tax=Ceriporiopsis subvermispora (strain B) TaxID=914234 RepID=M2QQV0_CERS8|nr:hypothetical protein CERSUDRAFT_75520 [Gelatoporia subvermispora B]
MAVPTQRLSAAHPWLGPMRSTRDASGRWPSPVNPIVLSLQVQRHTSTLWIRHGHLALTEALHRVIPNTRQSAISRYMDELEFHISANTTKGSRTWSDLYPTEGASYPWLYPIYHIRAQIISRVSSTTTHDVTLCIGRALVLSSIPSGTALSRARLCTPRTASCLIWVLYSLMTKRNIQCKGASAGPGSKSSGRADVYRKAKQMDNQSLLRV